MRPAALATLMLIAQTSAAGTPDIPKPVHWTGVEVVMEDTARIPAVRAATGIQPGATMAMDDPRLPAACNSVRQLLPSMSVVCTAIIDNGASGHYVVMAGVPVEETPASTGCTPTALAPDLQSLHERISQDRVHALATGSSSPEYVNGGQYLDYQGRKNHERAQQYHAALRDRGDDVARAAASCDDESRAAAMELLNFVGDGVRAADIASRYAADAAPSVRNNALRLLSTFSGFVKPGQERQLARTACLLLRNQLFTDQNKSLSLLDSLLQRKRIASTDLPAECRHRIRDIAAHSIMDQRRGFATSILGKLE